MEIDLIVFGSSTGGPKALYKIVESFDKNINIPIVIVQHIPPTFETSLAEVLNSKTDLEVIVAEPGMKCENGKVYVCKGGYQTELDNKKCFLVTKKESKTEFSPSINNTLLSAEKYYNRILTFILSGLSTRSDGLEGCKVLFKKKQPIYLQDKESSFVYGMQKKIKEAGFYTEEINLKNIPKKIKELV